jgi:hypothetical protein
MQDRGTWVRDVQGTEAVAEGDYDPGVLSAIFAVSVRHRRPILLTALALSAALWFLTPSDRELPGHLLAGALVTFLLSPLLILLAVLTFLASRKARPATLLVDSSRHAFATPASPAQVYLTLMLIFFGATQNKVLLPTDHHGWPQTLFVLFDVLFLPVLGLHIAAAWRGLGVKLRPEGLHYRDFAGSLTVPWEALAPDYPRRAALTAPTLALTYVRPDLVRRRGLVPSGRRILRIDTVHAWFIADAIRHYVVHAEHRAAIGTQAEYRRLLQALTKPPATANPEPPT